MKRWFLLAAGLALIAVAFLIPWADTASAQTPTPDWWQQMWQWCESVMGSNWGGMMGGAYGSPPFGR